MIVMKYATLSCAGSPASRCSCTSRYVGCVLVCTQCSRALTCRALTERGVSLPAPDVVQESMTKPEGQIHFFPIIFDGKAIYEVRIAG